MEVLKLETWINEFGQERINLDELKEYLDFIVEARDRYDPERNSEWHHVMPRCLDLDKKFRDQGVRINGRDHLLAHELLVSCINDLVLKSKLACALVRMRRSCFTDLTSEEFERVRQTYSSCKKPCTESQRLHISVSLKKFYETHENSFKGRIHTRKTKELISCSQKRHYHNHSIIWVNNSETEKRIKEEELSFYESLGYIKGRLPLSESHKDKLRESFTGSRNPMYGRTHTEEIRQRISEKIKALPQKIWINNGRVTKMIYESDSIPDGWARGRGPIRKGS